MKFRRFIALAGCLLLVSCGGKWDDDKKNWSRAFNGQTCPTNVTVVHSRYSRSPHFTYEADYYFELNAPQEFLDGWLQGLVKETPANTNLGFLFDKPNWFIPKTLDHYEMWKPPDNPYSYFRIFRDKSTGTIFATDSQ